MLSGDLSTMALPDFLQWADATRVSGVLAIERDAEVVWLQIAARNVIRASESPSQPVSLEVSVDRWEDGGAIEAPTLALEHLYDQFLDSSGSFRFRPGEDRTRLGVPVDIAVAELLMESMRLLDEWPRLDKAYPEDSMRPALATPESPSELTAVQQAVLRCVRRNQTLAEIRMTIGLSRPALLRRLDELRALGYVSVEGAPSRGDLSGRLVSQAKKLMKEKQFDEAAHVFGALLSSDPTARSVRALLREAEREQVLWLYDEIPAHSVPKLIRKDLDRRTLTHADRELLDRINGVWDVAVLVLSSPLREVETLKTLRKLRRLRAIELTQG
jgi:DNA-binding Lrp family transcriptional regulator